MQKIAKNMHRGGGRSPWRRFQARYGAMVLPDFGQKRRKKGGFLQKTGVF
jgi:hypothetical protein